MVRTMLWMLVAIGVGAVVGLARGGKPSNLTDLRVGGLALLVAGFLIQFISTFVTRKDLAVGLLLLSYLLLLVFAGINRSAGGMWIVGIGVLMNFSVIALNGGMPVLPEAAELAGVSAAKVAASAKHVVLDGSTRLPFLGDIIPLPGSVVSLGDVLLGIGLGVFIEEELRRPPRLFSRRIQSPPGSAVER